MELKNLNLLPQMIITGEITQEEGIKLLASFVCNNYPIYGLHKYDEDFRSEVFVKVLEKGNKVISTYNPDYGDFFTFTFCFVKCIIKSTSKKLAKKSIKDQVSFQQSVENYQTQNHRYEFIENSPFTNVPYSYKKITLEQLQEGLKNNKLEKYDKSILVLALKASYYLNDKQIQKLSNLYEIDIDLMYDIVQYFKDEIEPKHIRLQKEIERGNISYYQHRKNQLLAKYFDTRESECSEIEKEDAIRKDQFHIRNMEARNKRFDQGYLYLRPPTRSVSKVLGICERQANYYLNCLRHGKIPKDLLDKLKDDDE